MKGMIFMEIVGWIILGFLVVIFVIGLLRGANKDYTAGSGMFKNSENNLKRDERLDVSDYNYYDNKGKMK